jgi:hypothetical protein
MFTTIDKADTGERKIHHMPQMQKKAGKRNFALMLAFHAGLYLKKIFVRMFLS